ncbi:hypothetical protein GCM10010472_02130 [Pseudonocardia halophobica]|uniref:Uncharacterized protein n=1 Tax=Pseudonocardia halophobica TaxID=29401 RepID=A0A9W6KZJ8_9PSEU|nr:hypothetical protein [Pseudonocardia halophobica]GLL10553.1 hypothetical protein GCM10017577_16930 [Pseudonocardia halophobica]
MSLLRCTPRHPVTTARRDRAIREALSFEGFVLLATGRRRRRGRIAPLSAAERAALDELPGPLDVLVLVDSRPWLVADPVPHRLAELARLADHTGRVRLHVVPSTHDNRDLELAYGTGGSEPVYVVLDAYGAALGVLGPGHSPVLDGLSRLVHRGC